MSDSLQSMDCRPSGSSVHWVSQGRTLGWVALSFSGASSWLRARTCISRIGRWFLYPWATREAPVQSHQPLKPGISSQLWSERDRAIKNDHRDTVLLLWRRKERPQAEDCGQPLEAEKRQETESLPPQSELTEKKAVPPKPWFPRVETPVKLQICVKSLNRWSFVMAAVEN